MLHRMAYRSSSALFSQHSFSHVACRQLVRFLG
jgi:hypothetical protein